MKMTILTGEIRRESPRIDWNKIFAINITNKTFIYL